MALILIVYKELNKDFNYLSQPFRGTGGYSTATAPSTNTVTLLFNTSTKTTLYIKNEPNDFVCL
jgi:hypothetical protein